VEYWVNLYGGRQLKFVGVRADHSYYHVGADLFPVRLLGGALGLEVPGG
jgi:hypothetical protein